MFFISLTVTTIDHNNQINIADKRCIIIMQTICKKKCCEFAEDEEAYERGLALTRAFLYCYKSTNEFPNVSCISSFYRGGG